jgi:tape measure domain-containing protein
MRSINQVERSLGKMSQTLQSAGRSLTESLTLPLGAVAAASLKSFAELEKLNKGLVAIMGSTELAADELARLREVARLPGLGLKEAVQGSINLQAVGLSADEARNTLMGFGKALAATGKGKVELEAIQYQLTQMISKNKLLAEDYKAIQSNLPLMAEGMQAAFGTKNIEAIRETGIGAKEFTLRLSEALAKLPQTQNVTGGLANAFENLQDSLFIAGAQMGEAINQAFGLEGKLGKLAGVAQWAADAFTALSPGMQKAIVLTSAFAASLGPVLFVIGKMGSIIPGIIQGLKGIGAAMTFLANNPVGLVIVAIGALVAALIYAYKNSERFREVVQRVSNVVRFLAEKAVDYLRPKLEALVAAFGVLVAAVHRAIVALRPLWEFIAMVGKGFVDVTVKATKVFLPGLIGVGNAITNVFSQVAKEIKANISAISTAFELIKEGKFKEAFQSFGKEMTNDARNIGNAAKEGFEAGFEGTVGFFQRIADEYNRALDTVKPLAPKKDIIDTTNNNNDDPDAPTGPNGQPRNQRLSEVAPLPTLQANIAGLAPFFETAAAEEKIKGLGVVMEELKVIQSGLFTDMAEKSRAAAEEMQKMLDSLYLGLTTTGETFIQWGLIAQDAAIAGLSSFSKEVEGGINSLKAFGRAVKNAAVDIIGSLIKQGVTSIIANTLTKLGALGPLAIPIAAAAASLAKGLFTSAINGISAPKLARGGVTTGETLAVVGDNPSGREAIIPFERMGEFLDMAGGGAMKLTGLFEVRGQDLLLVIDRANQEKLRVR